MCTTPRIFLKEQLRSSAIVRKMKELNPVINYETRSSGKHPMLKRFVEIRDALKEACYDIGLKTTSIGTGAFSRR